MKIEEVIRMFDELGRFSSRRMPERAISTEQKLLYIERDLGGWLHNYPTVVNFKRRSQDDCELQAEIMIAIRDDYRAKLKSERGALIGGCDAPSESAQG